MKVSRREFTAYQDLVLGFKKEWTTRSFQLLCDRFGELATAFQTAQDRPPSSSIEVADILRHDTSAQMFAFMERHLQRMKYSGRFGLHTVYSEDRDSIIKTLNSVPTDSYLELDDDIRLPDYYTSVDIHQHPGGVWSDDIAGAVYEHGARSTTPMMQHDRDLHQRFTDTVLARKQWKRLLDLGCGFGKSTGPFVEARPEASTIGVDLSAPCLKLAARDAAAGQRRNVQFRQRDARFTRFPDENFDVATSTMLLHEMPPDVINEVVAETYRVLEPGGISIHLDFLPPDDPFLEWLHYGHGKRNNEPFMEPLAKMDIRAAMRAAGFQNVEVLPFEEASGSLEATSKIWRFPWTVIVGEKPHR